MSYSKNEILSPITGSNNVEKIDSIETSLIISEYKKDYKLDVSRYFRNLDTVEVYKCRDSGYRFYYPNSTAGDEQFYSDFQEVLGNYYKPIRWEYKYAMNLIRSTDRVLEIGTGSGIFFEMLSKKVCEPRGLELSNRAIEEAQKKGFDIQNELIELHSQKFENHYDVVCFFQVLEHITDVRSFFASAVKCLKPGGKIIFAVPNNNPYIYRYLNHYTSNLPPHHSGIWNKESISNLSNFFNVDLLEVKVEPLFGIHYQLKLWAASRGYFKLERIIDKMPVILIKALGKLAPFFDGVNVIGVFNKRFPVENK